LNWVHSVRDFVVAGRDWIAFAALVIGVVTAILRFLKNRKEAPNWVAAVNEYFRLKESKLLKSPGGTSKEEKVDAARVLTTCKREPAVDIMGNFQLSPEQARYAAAQQPKDNDPHAILCKMPDWKASEVKLRVHRLDYRAVLAIDKFPINPEQTIPLISASGVLICRDRKELILHYRAETSRTYPNCVHTIGGAYKPPGFTGTDDGLLLSNIFIREVDEEVKAHINLDNPPPMVLLEEPKTGFIQLAFLGVNISRHQADNLDFNWEGSVRRVRFDELGWYLCNERWVPTGKAAVLAWLAVGAPGASRFQKFSGRTPAELFHYVIGTASAAKPTTIPS
jgi:hypothetical protein